jgi:pectin methylesterase-like acyl-CoA thioesterase
MSIIVSWMKYGVLFLALALFSTSAECSDKVVSREVTQVSKKDLFRPPKNNEIADFEAWIYREGKRAQLKKENAAAQHKASLQAKSATLENSSNLDVQTWIVVDQNGYGQFTTVQEAINSIPVDQGRMTRITIQVNPGYY